MRPTRPLLIANLVLLGAMVVHAVDHVLQERGVEALTTEVRVGGPILLTLAVISFVLLLRDHPRAPFVATVVGFWIAANVTSAHFLPHWSAFSDPYMDLGLSAFSWAAAGFEVACALTLGVVGALALRRGTAAPRVATG